MKDLINLLTLSFAKGYRTFLAVGVIIVLAMLQWKAHLVIPQEVWLILFGIVAACLRAGMSPATAVLSVCLCLCGCSTINQTNYIGNDALDRLCATNRQAHSDVGITSGSNSTMRVSGCGGFSQSAALMSAKDISPNTTAKFPLY